MDRQFLAAELGCVGVCPNSMDAVSDRDFVAETVFAAALHLVHLSRWAEDLIIYSSGQYRFVQCSDAYATGAAEQAGPAVTVAVLAPALAKHKQRNSTVGLLRHYNHHDVVRRLFVGQLHRPRGGSLVCTSVAERAVGCAVQGPA